MPDFYGFEETENVTFLNYTATPVRRLRYNFAEPRVISEKQYNALDWSIRPISSIPHLNSVVTISNEDIRDVKLSTYHRPPHYLWWRNRPLTTDFTFDYHH